MFHHLIWSGGGPVPMSVHSGTVDFGSVQGRSKIGTAGVAALRRGFQICENVGQGRKMSFLDEQKKNPRTGSSASPGIYRLHQGFNRWYAAGLLTRASPYSPGLPGVVRQYRSPPSGIFRFSSALTAAGPRRIHTGFPLRVHLHPRSDGPSSCTRNRIPIYNSGRSSIGRGRCQRLRNDGRGVRRRNRLDRPEMLF